MKQLFPILGHLIFWSWNLTFSTIVYLGILPLIAPPLIVDGFLGLVPVDILLTLLALMAVPTLCTFLGLFYFLRRPLHLMRLFYGVEAPLFFLCLIRLFLIREVTPASAQVLWTVLACIVIFLLELFYGYRAEQPRLGRLQLIGHSLMLWVGLFAGALFAFYAIPLGWVLLQAFFKFEWLGALFSMFISRPLETLWWLPLSVVLFFFTATLFVIMPFALSTFYVQSWRRVMLASLEHQGRLQTWIGTVAPAAVWMILFWMLQQQPQLQAFQTLKTLANTDQNRQTLLTQSESVRRGLLNAYLLPYRYLSTTGNNNHIEQMYQSVFHLARPEARFLQDCYNQLMSPFLYQGSNDEDDRAEKLYEEFFDVPIQKAERKAIQHALTSTYNRSEAKAGLISINQETVWVKQQRVTVTEQRDWADVELYEVYENKTNDEQEVFYSFSLPESAVITGLWLGNSEKLDDRYPFVVSPRGAAQEVYNQQVQRRVDPALLEQVGPRHYRLRAFPVPRQAVTRWDQKQQLHLWLTYKVMRQDAGWAMPQLGEKRNAFWTGRTERILNGKKVKVDRQEWLPAFLPASNHRPLLHQISLADNYQMTVKPLADRDYRLPNGKRFAIVVDSSRSMGAHRQDLVKTFTWLKQVALKQNQADLYITRSPGMVPQRFDNLGSFEIEKLTFYGTVQLQQMLEQFNRLRKEVAYDAILLVTDEGSYELSKEAKALAAVPAPLWMVHLGGQLPPAYDDTTLQAIQGSNGGVSTDPQEVLRRLATKTALGAAAVNVMDGYAWLTGQVEQATAASSSGFAPIAARQLIVGLSREVSQAGQLAQLDAMHAIAKSYKIVTPYSSMIVLVNDAQREALKQAEARKDRFDREVETGKEQLTKPGQPFEVSGVPEPEEWLLLAVVAIGLVLIVRYRRKLGSSL
ncbi:exosortase [Leptolyngbya sp. 'hensonii']|uniref:TIGR02921 family PEP-CTERM protein n=1 Tax=Leptolyngbya sp. 'hensonii' TaxID=1922337 RepID=UPI000950115F|nr:TIGR02921 family PEP-CTERM protein [Leptolyngbya sp. 'hensonii']OLP16529.1 exosortase [Leptolyngbya sp. 'hensonii']